MNYYNEIKDKLIKNEVSRKVREYVSNKNDLTTYYEVGRLLSIAGKHYGEGIIKEYSSRLQKEIGKKYNERTLRRIRQFYIFIKNQSLINQLNTEKWSPMATELTWSHYQELLPIKNFKEIEYYINEVTKNHLSKRALREKIKNKEYERLPDETKQKLINYEKLEITDSIKEPIILHKRKDYDRINELALKEIIMNDLDNFLKQLGDDFCYIENEYIIKYSTDKRIKVTTYEII